MNMDLILVGQSTLTLIILATSGLMVFLAGYFLLKKKTSKTQDNISAAVELESLEVDTSLNEKKKLLEKNFQQRLQLGLTKSRQTIWGKVTALVSGKILDQDTKDQLESILYQADIPNSMVEKIIKEVEKHKDGENIFTSINTLMMNIFKKYEQEPNHLHALEASWLGKIPLTSEKPRTLQVVMIVGVNGVGKTTTVGKLAAGLSRSGLKVVVAAADTFRAAAKEQLQIWCERASAELITGHENNQDPAAVCYQAVARSLEIKADYCLLDTAGRLHNNDQLMEELKKIKRVITKLVPDAPHETLIVLDAMTGQNALKQALQFKTALDGLSGVVLTKCDGSAKAGCALAIVEQLNVPIRFIGVGESLEDLDIFHPQDFTNALLAE